MQIENIQIQAIQETTTPPKKIAYGFTNSPYGKILIGQTGQGVCWLSFDETTETLKKRYPGASLEQSHIELGETITLALHGTEFQRTVWKALLNIPHGKTTTYQDIAAKIGRPSATRAVGTAIGANPISMIIPCHRVIRADGGMGGYAWGLERKEKILAAEVA